MRSSKSIRPTVPAVASTEDFIPGLAPLEGGAETPGHQSDTTSRSGWWVRRSARQKQDAAGRPAGYWHQLMLGHKIIKSGVGADCGRTFRQQAEFLNTRDELRLGSKEPTDVAAEDQPGPPHD